MPTRVPANRIGVSFAAQRRTRFILATSALPMVLCAAAILWAQTPGPDEIRVSSRPYTPPAQTVLRVNTQLVEVGVVVRNGKGQTVADLKQSSFRILDNGKPQNISGFSIEKFANAPEPGTTVCGGPCGNSFHGATGAGQRPPAAAICRHLF